MREMIMKTKFTQYLWMVAIMMAFPMTMSAQLADVSYTVRVGNVFSSEFGNLNAVTNCQEIGNEEYTAFAGFSDNVNGAIVSSSCMTCDNNGDCNYGGGTPLGSRTNNAYFMNYFLNAWEDDGTRCSFNSGDDCQYNGSPGGVYLRELSLPSNGSYVGVATGNLGNRHRLTLEWTWKYSGTASPLAPACASATSAYSNLAIRSWSVNLVAGRTYRFSTVGQSTEDTYMRLFGANGFTLVADNDDFGTGLQSQIDFTPASSGTYYVELSAWVSSTNTRGYLLNAGSLLYQDISTPVVNAGTIANNLTICTGGNASLTSSADASGGFDGNFTYVWESSTNGTTWTPISNTNSTVYGAVNLTGTTLYRRRATDCRGTTAVSNVVTVTVVADPVVTVASAAPAGAICVGGSNLLTASATGGSGSIIYQWQQFVSGSWQFIAGQSASTYLASPAATTDYRVVVSTGVSGCNGNAAQTVTVVADPTLQVTGSNVACNGASTGSATATLSGGTGGNSYSYSWSNGQTGTSASGLAAGQYTVTASGNFGCNATASVNITQPSALSASSTSGSIACNGGSTTVTVSGNGGTAPYTGTGTFTVTAGTYSYTVTDANGCTATTSITVSEPTALSASSTSGSIACNGGSTTVTVSASGGTAPYTGTGSFTVTAGTYSYTVTDANGCTATTSITVAEPSLLTASSTSGSIACNGGSTTVTVSGNGGTAPYTGTGSFTVTAGTYSYTVTDANGCTATTSITVTEPTRLVASYNAGSIACNGGTTTVSIGAFGGTAPYSGTGNYTLGAGTYSYTVTDANGCTDVVNFTITEPSALSASSVSGTILCNGGNTTVVVNASGGTAPYTGTGSFTVTAGTYSYTVTDANGCTAITSITVTEPSLLTASSTSGSISCNGGSTTVTVSGNGGTAPYTGTGSFTVFAGVHTYTVTDANGCTATTSITVTEPTLLTVSTVSSNVSCNGANDGSASASGNGGTPTYSYLWSNGATTSTVTGLAPGNYSVTVTDNNGCTADASLTITQPAPLVVSAGSDQVIYIGYTSNCVTLSEQVSGGTPAYISTWSDANGQVGTTVCPTTTTTYTVMVTDANGCTASDEMTVCVVDVRCAGGNNNGQGGSGQGGNGSTNGNGIQHVQICHIPPGNPNNAMTKCLPISAVPGHLGHGDYLGACGSVLACNVSGQVPNPMNLVQGNVMARMSASPNPTNGTSTIELVMPEAGRVSLRIYDSRGVMVADLFEGVAGSETPMQFEWNSQGMSSGLYIVRLETQTGETRSIRLMVNQ